MRSFFRFSYFRLKEYHIMEYDVLVIGGGHAGLEASIASAKMGAKTHLITLLIQNLALASCNPAVGGLGKGH